MCLALIQKFFLLGQLAVALHDFHVAVLDLGENLVFQVHAATELLVGGSSRQAQQNALQLSVVGIVETLVDAQQLGIALVLMRLVEDAQHPIQPCVHLSAQQGYLYDDALVRQTLDKGIRHALGHQPALVVAHVVLHVEHRLADVAHAVAQQVDHHHGQSILFSLAQHHVFRVAILTGQVLAEA